MDFELSANGADGALLDLRVTWDRSHFAGVTILPQGVIAAFAHNQALVPRQMSLQIAPFHGVAKSIVSRIVEDSWR